MTTANLTAGEVMDKAASLMNDSAKQTYTYAAQLPYLQMACQDLRKLLELNNSPVTDELSAVIEVPSGLTVIAFGTVDPKLPDDLVEIQQLWERQVNSNPWIPMTRQEFLPLYLEGVESNQWLIWAWNSNEIRLPAANSNNELKIDYIRSLFTDVEDENTELAVINADSYLEFRTAALLAEFVGENPTRAAGLNLQAIEAFNIMAGIDNKGKQAIYTRRRPFRAAFKQRGVY